MQLFHQPFLLSSEFNQFMAVFHEINFVTVFIMLGHITGIVAALRFTFTFFLLLLKIIFNSFFIVFYFSDLLSFTGCLLLFLCYVYL